MLIRVRSSISMPKTIIVPSRRWYSVWIEGLKMNSKVRSSYSQSI